MEEGEFEWRDVEPGCNIDGGSIRRWRERGGKAFQDWLYYLSKDPQPEVEAYAVRFCSCLGETHKS